MRINVGNIDCPRSLDVCLPDISLWWGLTGVLLLGVRLNVVIISGNQTAMFLTGECSIGQHVKPPLGKIYSKSASSVNQHNQEVGQNPEAQEWLRSLNNSVFRI